MKKLFAVLAALSMLAFAVPAMAAEQTTEARLAALEDAFQCSWKFYGNARMSTFYEDDSAEDTGTGFDDTDLTWALQGNSRIGAKVMLGDIIGHFEYSSAPGLRLLYGKWNFGAGNLTIGQDYTPMDFFISNQVWGGDNDLLGFGSRYTGRQNQIKLGFGNFQIAAINPNVVNPNPAVFADTDVILPMFEACYDIKTGPVTARISASYQTYDAVIQTATSETEHSVDAYQLAAGFKYNIGAFFLNGDIYMGQNIVNGRQWYTGNITGNTYDTAVWDPVSQSIQDSDSLGFALVAGFKMNDMITFEAGYGQVENERDFNNIKRERDWKSYYLNATINLAKGVFMVPEIGKLDYGDDEVAGTSTDMGDMKYIGAKWQINF